MNYQELKDYIKSEKSNNSFLSIYSSEDLSSEKERYLRLLEGAYDNYGDGDYIFISSPGRSEIGGNHTDHQHGCVLACALSLDNVTCVKRSVDVNYVDGDFKITGLNIADLDIHEEEKNTSNSLIRGIGSKLCDLGYEIGGFSAYSDSRVLVGSGISSSACFEVMVTEIFNSLYCDEKINDVDRAIISQYAENVYFGKPSGLMDQMAISVGGFISIDFKEPSNPIINKIAFSFKDYGYDFALVNTKGNHKDLSMEYAAITGEIKLVSKAMGVEYLRDKSSEYFFKNFKNIRETVKNDRAMLRAYHFYLENERAQKEADALKNKDIKKMLNLMNESGRSSYMYLQNVYPSSRIESQSLSIGLALAATVLNDDGAYRVHGGGFDGTIQVIIPHDKLNTMKNEMISLFGDDSMLIATVREKGCVRVLW